VDTPDEPLIAEHPEIPGASWRSRAFDGVAPPTATIPSAAASCSRRRSASPPGGERTWEWEIRGDRRGSLYEYDQSTEAGAPGARATVHHVAWADQMDQHEAWQKRVAESEAHPTPIIDRFWFLSIYFREPSGVLFEIATLGPGFATDEDAEHLGEKLVLPPRFEPLRDQVGAHGHADSQSARGLVEDGLNRLRQRVRRLLAI